MRIAVTYENKVVFQHFGHTKAFKVYDVEESKIIKSEVLQTLGEGHGELVGFLKRNYVDVLICGGIGGSAQSALKESGVILYGGVQGNADEVVKKFLNNELACNENIKCTHHDHGENHQDDHHCGGHCH